MCTAPRRRLGGRCLSGMGLVLSAVCCALLAPGASAQSKTAGFQRGAGGPGARAGHRMVWDAAGKRAVMFGGMSVPERRLLNGTWLYDPEADEWEAMKTEGQKPPGRAWCGMVLDPRERRLVVFGGSDGGPLGDLWTLDLESRKWTRRKPEGKRPRPRFAHGCVLDAKRRRVIVFGGTLSVSKKEAGSVLPAEIGRDTWALDLEAFRWKELPRGVHPRVGFACEVDERSGRMLVFGGEPRDSPKTHSFDLERQRWRDLGKGVGPVRAMASAFDAKTRTWFLLGGVEKGAVVGTVRLLDPRRAKLRSADVSIPWPCMDAAACYVPERRILLLHGGAGSLAYDRGEDAVLRWETRRR